MVFDHGSLKPVPLQQWLADITLFSVSDLPAVLARLPDDPADHTSKGNSATTFSEAVIGEHNTGARRPTLVSLAGHLRSRGIREEIAVELLIPWARQHFSPPLPDNEVEKHVRGIYQRYGVVSTRRSLSRRALPIVEVAS